MNQPRPKRIIVDLAQAFEVLPDALCWSSKIECLNQVLDHLVERYPTESFSSLGLDTVRLVDYNKLVLNGELDLLCRASFTTFYLRCLALFKDHSIQLLTDNEQSFDYVLDSYCPTGKVALKYVGQ
jgi:hypothetical protein